MTNLLALLDDIATTLDDVAVMSKIAVKKTSALMSDDLAVNAGVVHGVSPNREIPIVKAIFYGSLLNKVYCIAGVLLLMATYPPLIKVILFIGGLYLSYEGVHKIVEKLSVNKEERKKERLLIPEIKRIKGAIRTDLILSIEIIVIAKTNIKGPMLEQVLTLITVGILASVLIYGLVAILIKIDDLGLVLIDKGHTAIGKGMVGSMPYMMKGLGIVGTLAMLLVGGGILGHTFHLPYVMPEVLQNFLMGILGGALCLIPYSLYKKFN